MKAELESSEEQAGDYHTPVLLKEAISALQINKAGIYVDCTFGGGGHARAILEQLGPDGRLVAFDQDPDARNNLPEDDRILFIPHNFRHLHRFLRLNKIDAVDGILADLGVSSHQFESSDRGFSTRFEGQLDMRMDKRQEVTAATVLATFTETALHKMFEQFGEVTNAKTLAKTITEARRVAQIQTISDFKTAIHAIVKGNPNKYLAQVFQALRIEVNQEVDALKEMLEQVPGVLQKNGRVAVITFHSLEDRIVKTFFKHGGFEESEQDLFGNKVNEPPLTMITKKPIVPGKEEMKKNPRSRSAKLRVAEK